MSKESINAILKLKRGTQNPSVTATFGKKGDLLLREATPFGLYQKLDDGLTVNWSLIPSTFPIYGTVYEYEQDRVQRSTNSLTYVNASTLVTSNLLAGDYRIAWYYRWERTSSTNRARFRVQLNGVTDVMERNEQTLTNTNSRLLGTGFQIFSLVGINTITLDFATNNAGTATLIDESLLEILRIA